MRGREGGRQRETRWRAGCRAACRLEAIAAAVFFFLCGNGTARDGGGRRPEAAAVMLTGDGSSLDLLKSGPESSDQSHLLCAATLFFCGPARITETQSLRFFSDQDELAVARVPEPLFSPF
ncbi:hypothetical protein MRB53_020220 [Persea americana]|uniref:Uncharacterized protein n=1 Tax=Persea americana TaxID=3435 RepID=A0ACC2L0N2_PERAE|nr:hypothetical protein MRB53_020220 [Persea americana]